MWLACCFTFHTFALSHSSRFGFSFTLSLACSNFAPQLFLRSLFFALITMKSNIIISSAFSIVLFLFPFHFETIGVFVLEIQCTIGNFRLKNHIVGTIMCVYWMCQCLCQCKCIYTYTLAVCVECRCCIISIEPSAYL